MKKICLSIVLFLCISHNSHAKILYSHNRKMNCDVDVEYYDGWWNHFCGIGKAYTIHNGTKCLLTEEMIGGGLAMYYYAWPSNESDNGYSWELDCDPSGYYQNVYNNSEECE